MNEIKMTKFKNKNTEYWKELEEMKKNGMREEMKKGNVSQTQLSIYEPKWFDKLDRLLLRNSPLEWLSSFQPIYDKRLGTQTCTISI